LILPKTHLIHEIFILGCGDQSKINTFFEQNTELSDAKMIKHKRPIEAFQEWLTAFL
jgi:hypothetical protein